MARLREGIQLADYDNDANTHVLSTLEDATNPSSSDASECLLNLAFIICTEPERAPLFVPYLGQLLSTAAKRLCVCQEDEVLTLAVFGFHLMVRSHQKGIGTRESVGKALSNGLLTRMTLSIPTIGKILTAVVVETQAEQLVERDTCRIWIDELLKALRANAPESATHYGIR
ncbi:MAG: hypothetical protein ACREYF_28385 [Gammaproteobacteria bacterium]